MTKKITISRTNSKLSGEIPSVSLSRFRSCRKDAPCFKKCYAGKGNFTFPKVVQSLENNFQIWEEDHDDYFNQIIAALNGLTLSRYFRWHTCGDIVDDTYLVGMVRVAKECPNTKFLAFTKKFDIVNNYLATGQTLPDNLKIVFSAWDKNFNVPNPYGLPVSYVWFKNNELNPNIPQLAIPCEGHCEQCLACWSLVNGQSVVFKQH